MSDDLQKLVLGVLAAGGIGFALLGGASPEKVPGNVGLSPAASICPKGWSDTSMRDEHTVILSCSRNGWLVILNADGSFNYALLDPAFGPSAGFIFDSRGVPGWPR